MCYMLDATCYMLSTMWTPRQETLDKGAFCCYIRPNFILIIFIPRILGAIFPGDSLETEDVHPLEIRNWLSQTS